MAELNRQQAPNTLYPATDQLGVHVGEGFLQAALYQESRPHGVIPSLLHQRVVTTRSS